MPLFEHGKRLGITRKPSVPHTTDVAARLQEVIGGIKARQGQPLSPSLIAAREAHTPIEPHLGLEIHLNQIAGKYTIAVDQLIHYEPKGPLDRIPHKLLLTDPRITVGTSVLLFPEVGDQQPYQIIDSPTTATFALKDLVYAARQGFPPEFRALSWMCFISKATWTDTQRALPSETLRSLFRSPLREIPPATITAEALKTTGQLSPIVTST